jgi:hypothetical protein
MQPALQVALDANVAQLASATLPTIFELWKEEEDRRALIRFAACTRIPTDRSLLPSREVVNELCSSLSDVLMIVGPALIVPTCTPWLRLIVFRRLAADRDVPSLLQTSRPFASISKTFSLARLCARSTTSKRTTRKTPTQNSPSWKPN